MKFALQLLKISAGGVFAAVLFIAAWHLAYSSAGDPKNPRYVLWKLGVYRMDPELAIAPMVGDAHRDDLVIGKSKEELRQQFGYLTTFAQAPSYIKTCYLEEGMHYEDVLFIRNGPWMVSFKEEKASELVLFKGC